MSAVNPNSLSKFVGLLYVAPQSNPMALTRIASVRGTVFNYNNTDNQVEVNADDTGTVFKGFRPEATIEGTFLENVDRDLINLLLNGTPSDVTGAIVNNYVQTVLSGAWNYNQFIQLDFQNGDGTQPNIDSVTGSVDGALVLGTDYVVTAVNGKYGITLISGGAITTLVQNIAIQFDYTPNASENITLALNFQESPRLYVKIVAESDGKERRIILDDATFEGTYALEFLDVVEAGDLTGTTFLFRGNRGSNAIIENEIL